jgi:hypothetical protein
MLMLTLIEKIEREMTEADNLLEHLQSEDFVGWASEQGLARIDPRRGEALEKTVALIDKIIKPLEKIHREIVKAKDVLADRNPKQWGHGKSDTLMYNAMSNLSYLSDAIWKNMGIAQDVISTLYDAGEAAMPKPRD